MPSLLICHAQLYTPTLSPEIDWVYINDGSLQDWGSRGTKMPSADQKIDAHGLLLVPGFIDQHVHGAMGFDTMDAEPEGLIAMAQYYAKRGVTSFLPTTWAAPIKDLRQVFTAVKQTMQTDYNGAKICGMHLEGPFLCAQKAGAQNPSFIFPATTEDVREIIAQNIVKLITIAPEIPENLALVPALKQAGIVVSAGHTQANYEEMVTAVQHGVSCVTHSFNAMTGIHHREPGTVGAALTLNDLYLEIIADKIHIHPAILQLVVNSKPKDRLLLVTDAIRGTGLEDGVYPVDDRKIIIEGGIARLENGSLAGSTLTMIQAIKNMVAVTQKSLEDILPAATSNPATLLGIANRKGSLLPGMDADMVLLSPDFDIHNTIIAGKIIHSS